MHRAACVHFSTNLYSSKTIQWIDSSIDTVQLNSNLMLACNEPREDTRESRAFYKITRFLCYFPRDVTL